VLSRWLEHQRYQSERVALEQVVDRATSGDEAAIAELQDAFVGPLPIGTGGRRGLCGPGPNRMNAVVLRETAHGLVLALRTEEFGADLGAGSPRVAIAYDTRRNSAEFARLVAGQLAAEGCEVLLLTAPRPTPQLALFMRRQACHAGVVISASHNPPSDNGIKIYGPDGAQVLAETAKALMDGILQAAEQELPGLDGGEDRVEEVDPAQDPRADAAYHAYVLEQGVTAGSLADSKLKVVFTPLHGVGHTSVMPVLLRRDVDAAAVERQCDPDGGRFSTVPTANPEVPESMAMAIEQARSSGADIVMACDPDADRLGACVPGGDDWLAIDGNRLGVLILDHLLESSPSLPDDGWILTTMVTSPLIAKLARARDVECIDDLLVGFKHHAGMVRERPQRPLIYGCEESHGYIRGNDIRDKDGAIAALLLTECAAACKHAGQTLLARLDRIWGQYGYHREQTANLWARGQAGREAIAAVMKAWRNDPPSELARLAVIECSDRNAEDRKRTGSPTRDLAGNVLAFELAAGDLACRLVLRPSGTEPKLKLYAMASASPTMDLETAKREVDALAERVLDDAKQRAERIMAPLLPESPGA
jgi:phosphoglucomutase/phosphomannomutase